MTPDGFAPGSADTRRAEHTALLGMLLHLICAAGLLVASRLGVTQEAVDLSGTTAYAASGIFSYKLLWLQVGGGVFFFLASLLQLRMRRLAVTEAYDRQEIERQRKQQGMGSLFADDEVGPALRNLRQFNHYIAPALSVVFALILLLPAGYAFYEIVVAKLGFAGFFFGSMPRSVASVYGVLPIVAGFLFFVIGIYASGLCKARQWRPVRAGAGYALSSAGLLALCGACLLLSGKVGFYPERVAGILICLWSALQGIEVLVNVILDHYRPRLPDTEQRPAYDSRLSGLLAEPQSIFKTFAHTLDYQFGFRVSQTWFFRFVERAFAPLILILIFSFYILSSVVVVKPGQAAIIERFGAPRGFYEGAENDWDQFAQVNPPLGEGLHLKWPWPIEKARVVDRSRLSQITLGFGSDSEDESRKKADELRGKMAEWDKQHVENESLYLMPLPSQMRSENAVTAAAADASPARKGINRANYVLVSGSFMVEFQIVTAGDVYRYAYNYRDPHMLVRAVAEKEITAFLGGANFWDVMARQSHVLRDHLLARISANIDARNIGLRITNIGISNIHPPAGEVGKAFLDVIASRQKKQLEIYKGEVQSAQIIGLAPGQAQKLVTEAQAYKFRREQVAQAEGVWFADQLKAFAAAPVIYPMAKQMQMLENALGSSRKVLLPASATLIMDDAKAADPDAINNYLARQIDKLNAKN